MASPLIPSWNVSQRRAQSAATVGSQQWFGTLTTVTAVDDNNGAVYTPHIDDDEGEQNNNRRIIDDGHGSQKYTSFSSTKKQQRPASCLPILQQSSTAIKRQPETRNTSPGKYWELGGLGPAQTPEWQRRCVRKERQQQFGDAVNAANMMRRKHGLEVCGEKGCEKKPTATNSDDEGLRELVARAEKRDVDAALALL